MAELKTQPNDQSVEDFLNSVADGTKRQDRFTLPAACILVPIGAKTDDAVPPQTKSNPLHHARI